jgi:ribose transport system permease protein
MSAPSLSLANAPAVRGRWARRNAWPLAVYALLIVLLGVEKIVHPALNGYDMQSLVGGALPLALAAMAQAVVVISGGVDLSIGALMSLVNVVSAFYMVHADLKGALLVSALLVVGTALAGACTGLVITATRVPDIIVTLATSFVWSGLALQVMPTPGGGAPQEFADLLTGEIATVIPSGVVALLVVVAVVWLPLRRARLGLALYAIGSNRTAAYLSGVSVARARVAAYAFGGVFAALAGLALTASTLNGNATSGTAGAGYTLNSVAAVVVGGVSLTGGRGGLLGPIAAAFVLTQINTILTFMGVDANVGTVIQGALVVVVVMVAGLLLLRRRA